MKKFNIALVALMSLVFFVGSAFAADSADIMVQIDEYSEFSIAEDSVDFLFQNGAESASDSLTVLGSSNFDGYYTLAVEGLDADFQLGGLPAAGVGFELGEDKVNTNYPLTMGIDKWQAAQANGDEGNIVLTVFSGTVAP